jgi:hypothetical protein
MNALVRAPLHGEILAPGDTITVVAATHPLRGDRRVLEMPAGSSIAEIVDRAAAECGLSRLVRGADVSIDGHLIPPENWKRVRVKAGAHVLVHGRVGKSMGNVLRSIFMIALSVLATFIVGPAGLGIAGLLGGGAFGAIGASFVAGAIMLGGGLLANTLFPPTATKSDRANPSYSISARANGASKWGPIPVQLGKVRANPKYAAIPYTEFVGDDQYLRMLFVWGYGPVDISDIKIGDTAISEFADVEIETRQGYADDAPQTLYPSEVVQENFGIDVTKADGPFVRSSAEDAQEIVIDLVAPQGIVDISAKDGSRDSFTVNITVEMRPTGSTGAWTSKGTITFKGKTNSPIRQSGRYTVGGGQWDIRLTRLTDDYDPETGSVQQGGGNKQVYAYVTWAAIKTFRTAPPINFRKPLAITALRIRASKQLNGAIDNLSALVTSIGASWSGSAWVPAQQTRNPGDLMRLVLQGPANARPQPDARLDLTAIAAFADHCAANGYTFDMYRDFTASVRDTLRDICAAARAVPTFRDGKWSVAWEEDDAPIIQHFTPRNSRDFSWTQSYRVFPHGLRCKFVNADKDYVEDEILVFDAGYTKDNATLYEQVEFPGVTSRAMVYKHAKYRIADARARPAVYTLTVDFEHLVAQRTDRVALAYDVILEGIASGRIQAINGQNLTLDEPAVMEAGKLYGIRIRRPDGTSVVRQVATQAGEQTVIAISGDVPSVGDLYTFGIRGSETGIYRILSIRPQADLAAELQLVDDGSGVQDGDDVADGDLPIPAAPTPVLMSAYTPTNLRGESDIVQVEVGSVYRTRLYWNAIEGPNYSSFEIVATSDGRTIRRVEDADTRASDFTDLATGEWSFTVRAFFTDGRYTPPSAALIVPINVPTGEVGISPIDFTDALRSLQESLASDARTTADALLEQANLIANHLSERYQVEQSIRTELSVAIGDATAAYTQAIAAAVGPASAIVLDITALQASISDAVAAANESLSTEVTTLDGVMTAMGDAITQVASTVGGVSADGTFRIQAVASPGGGWSRIAAQARASTADGWATASWFLDAKSDGTSRFGVVADQFIVTDGTDTAVPFAFTGGKAYLQGVVATSIEVTSAATGARTIITDTLIQVFDENDVERVRLGVWA